MIDLSHVASRVFRTPYDQGDAFAMIASIIAVWFAVLSFILSAGVALFAAIGATTSVLMG
jgi:hypothetical protein